MLNCRHVFNVGISTNIQHWKICCILNVVSTLKHWRSFNVENMLHLQRCFNVEIPTNVQRWKYVASSTLFQRWNTDERSTLKICCIFNVVSTLKKRWCCNVEISTLNQRWIIVVQRCNLYSTYFQRWNNVACLLGHSKQEKF